MEDHVQNQGRSLRVWLVMPFGLTNAPAIFMRLMSQILKQYLGKFLVIYFDNILIFSRSRDKHLRHLCLTFEILHRENMFLNSKKCSSLAHQVQFIGFIVSEEGLIVNQVKIEAISHWLEPQSAMEIQSFLCLAAFY